MPSNADNDDLLSRVLLTAVATLAADAYFTPGGSGVAIPVVSEVKEDIVQAIQQRNPAGLICIVGLDSAPNEDQGGGQNSFKEGRFIVRVRETVALNRSSSGTGENALRVAQAVAAVLDGTVAAKSSSTGTPVPGSRLRFLSISPAMADDLPGVDTRGVIAYHVTFRFHGPLLTFTRRGSTAVAGSP